MRGRAVLPVSAEATKSPRGEEAEARTPRYPALVEPFEEVFWGAFARNFYSCDMTPEEAAREAARWLTGKVFPHDEYWETVYEVLHSIARAVAELVGIDWWGSLDIKILVDAPPSSDGCVAIVDLKRRTVLTYANVSKPSRLILESAEEAVEWILGVARELVERATGKK